MDKLIGTIQSLAPVLLAYPRWAQGLFVLTTVLLFVSILVFLLLLPSVSAVGKQAPGAGTPGAASSFNISSPQSGDFLTTRRFSIEGTGADAAENNAMGVQLIDIRSAAATTVQGHLTVNSDSSWRFDAVEFKGAGPYDLVVDAIIGKKKYSRKLRINYELDVSSIAAEAVAASRPEDQAGAVAFVSENGPVMHVDLIRSVRVADAVTYDGNQDEYIFKHWGYLWTRAKILDLSADARYEISLDLKARIAYPGYVDQYPPELHLLFASGIRGVPETGNTDDISLLGERSDIVFRANAPVAIASTVPASGNTRSKPEGGILEVDRWHQVVVVLASTGIAVRVDGKGTVTALQRNLSGGYHLRIETWASTANWFLRNLKIKKIQTPE
jgi:hypothetical protein